MITDRVDMEKKWVNREIGLVGWWVDGSTGMSQCGRMSKEVSKCLYVFRWVDRIR